MSNSHFLNQDSKPTLTIDLKKRRIRIYKQTLHLLNDPEFIQFFVKPEKKTLAITGGTEDDISPQRIYWTTLTDKKQCCEFYSKRLIAKLEALINIQAETNHTYRVYGDVNQNNDRIFFDLSTAEVINDEMEAEESVICT